MLKIFTNLYLICSFLLISGCATTNKIDALKPEPDDATPLVYETTASYLNLPINIKLKDIENQTNIALSGLIYEDNNIDDDAIEMKIWKQAPITILSDKGEKIKN